MTLAWWPWPPSLLLLALVVGLGAGAVRGFAGFGFSALAVAALAPFVPPGPLVMAALGLEAVASAMLVRSVAGDVDRGWLRALLVGNAVCVPIGLAALVWLPLQGLRLLVAAVLLVGAVLLRLADGRSFQSTRRLRAAAGVSSGLLNGLAASGGIAAAMLMAATRPAPVALRATMITFLLWISLYALGWAAVMGWRAGSASNSALLGADMLRWMLVLWPTMTVGMHIGRRAFGDASPNRYRGFVLNLLTVIAALGLVNALVGLLRAG